MPCKCLCQRAQKACGEDVHDCDNYYTHDCQVSECARGVGVHVLCCGDHVVVCRDKHARSVCRARARKSTRACGADAFNDAFSHTLQPGCLALVVTVQSPTNGRPRRFGKL